MLAIDPKLVVKTSEIIGTDGITKDEIETRVLELVGDPMVARRLIDWIPEAFGTVVVSHIAKINFSGKFSAKDKQGKWQRFPTKAEPIFEIALSLAMQMHHEGSRDKVLRIAEKSAELSSASKAIDAGVCLDGAVSSGPALIGIPAEVYHSVRKPFWKRIFS